MSQVRPSVTSRRNSAEFKIINSILRPTVAAIIIVVAALVVQIIMLLAKYIMLPRTNLKIQVILQAKLNEYNSYNNVISSLLIRTSSIK